MVTRLRLEIRSGVAPLVAALVGCTARVVTHGSPGTAGEEDAGSGKADGASGSSGGTTSSSGGGSGSGPAAQYSGRGFVVHEWGTDTIVVGSDGSFQRGLHHEEEDLPPFVYDRVKAARELGPQGYPSVEVKMETPTCRR